MLTSAGDGGCGAAAAAGDGGCGATAAVGNDGCGVQWRLQRPVTAVAAASGSAGCGGAEARVSGSKKKIRLWLPC
jgi:hypothetical protein